MQMLRCGVVGLLLAVSAFAQNKPAKSADFQGSSTYSHSKDADGSENVSIRNIAFDVTDAGIPGRPNDQRLVLRKTTTSKRTVTDIGEEATVTLEAWPLGTDLHTKPLYTLRIVGTDGHRLESALFVADRGLEETEWWSVYRLGDGKHLFETYLPLVSFSISRETLEMRYVGMQIAEDDEKDARLKKADVVGVLTYASASKVIRELLITSDDPKQAPQLRSLADETRTLTTINATKGKVPSYSIKLTFANSAPL